METTIVYGGYGVNGEYNESYYGILRLNRGFIGTMENGNSYSILGLY